MAQNSFVWNDLRLGGSAGEDDILEKQLEQLFSDAVLPEPLRAPAPPHPTDHLTDTLTRRARTRRRPQPEESVAASPRRAPRAAGVRWAGLVLVLAVLGLAAGWLLSLGGSNHAVPTLAIPVERSVALPAPSATARLAMVSGSPDRPDNILPDTRLEPSVAPTLIPSPTPAATATREATPTQEPTSTPAVQPAATSDSVAAATRPAQEVIIPAESAARTAPAPTVESAAASVESSAGPNRLVIPAIDLEAPIITVGYDSITVDGQQVNTWAVPDFYAVGWHHTSAPPGEPGNTVLNGHQNIQGGVFRHLSALQTDDEIIVYKDGIPYYYRVAERHLLAEEGQPLSVRIQNASLIMPPDDVRLTLVTCAPDAESTHRLIIVARPASSAATIQ